MASSKTLSQLRNGILVSVAVSLFYFQFDLWRNYKYEQPQRDTTQNKEINTTNNNVQNLSASVSERNKAVNARIDTLQNLLLPTMRKVNIMISLNKEAIKKYNEMVKIYSLNNP